MIYITGNMHSFFSRFEDDKIPTQTEMQKLLFEEILVELNLMIFKMKDEILNLDEEEKMYE